MPTPADYLALAHTERDSLVLRRLVKCPYPFVRQALAVNPHTPPEALQELSRTRDSVWNDNRLLHLLAEHPRSDLVVLRAVLEAVAARLDDGERPYAASSPSPAGSSSTRMRCGGSAPFGAPPPVCATCSTGG